jgi:hypothetical protein
LSLRQPERHLLGFAVILVFLTPVGMARVGDGVDLFDCVRRRMLTKSTVNDDVIVPGLCGCQCSTPVRDQKRLTRSYYHRRPISITSRTIVLSYAIPR